MKLRIWHGCLVVAELEIGDDGLLPGRVAWRGTAEDSEVVGFIGDDDHISIDPWAKLAGEVKDQRSGESVSIAFQTSPPSKVLDPAAEFRAMPVFTIQAKDRLAVRAMWGYYEECMRAGLYQQATEVEKAIGEMELWRHNFRVRLCNRPQHKDRS